MSEDIKICKYVKVCKESEESCDNGLRNWERCIIFKYHEKIKSLFNIQMELLKAIKYGERISNERIKEIEKMMGGEV